MPASVPSVARNCDLDQSCRLADRHPDAVCGKTSTFGWGEVEVLSAGSGHRVERVSVKAGKSMPVHSHLDFSEHWTIVTGEAEIILDDDVLIAKADDSVYVSSGMSHGLRACGDGPVKLVAVQYGDAVEDHCYDERRLEQP